MDNKFEGLLKIIYRKWKAGNVQPQIEHPDEEEFACFTQGELSREQAQKFKLHLIACSQCLDRFITQAFLKTDEQAIIDPELIERIKQLPGQAIPDSIEIILRFRDRLIEIINTTGDVLVGQELLPAPLLRSRKVKDFKDEIIILKDIASLRLEVRVENKQGGVFDLAVLIKDKLSQKTIKDVRVTLKKAETELESYLADTGKVVFEHVLVGKYAIEISRPQEKLALIQLDIKT